MQKQLLLGFELELYDIEDYPSIYFYLDYLMTYLEGHNKTFLSK